MRRSLVQACKPSTDYPKVLNSAVRVVWILEYVEPGGLVVLTICPVPDTMASITGLSPWLIVVLKSFQILNRVLIMPSSVRLSGIVTSRAWTMI